MFSANKNKVISILHQIKHAIEQLHEWNDAKTSSDDYLLSPEGMKDLAASCMLVEAVGEGFKSIDKLTDGLLLPLYPSIPWKEVKGIRDKIAHSYFDIDADIIFESVKNDLPELIPAIDFFLQYLNSEE